MAKEFDLSSVWDALTKIGVIVTLTTAVIGVVWYFVALDSRIGRLESQFQALAISPAIIRSSDPAAAPVQNPLLSICADLASRAANSIGTKSAGSTQDSLKAIMSQLNCDARH
jgi:hypothetical protein